jgi:hypothetical protein
MRFSPSPGFQLPFCEVALRENPDAGLILTWALSRDRCYQMSNRFALAYRLAELGILVVLICLGFLAYDGV